VADLSAIGLGKLVRLLASDKPGEIVAAAHAIVRTLKKNGTDIHAFADHIEHTPTARSSSSRTCGAFSPPVTTKASAIPRSAT
jgi:hypothetical protein